MPQNKLWKFIAKRALMLFILLSLADIVLLKEKWIILAGLAIGSVFSVLKLGSLVEAFEKLLVKQDKRSKSSIVIVKFLINQIATVIILALSIVINLRLFAGVTAGILIVPAVVFINNITEIFGITHNKFE